MAHKKVLVTGASGLVGKVFLDHAHGKYELSALNRRAVDGIECLQADITDLAAIRPAFAGKDTVVHLAALAASDASFEQALNHNVIGAYNVFEAARQAGVRRVVFASSGASVMGWESEFPYNTLIEGRYDEAPEAWRKVTHETPTRPGGFYGWSKVAGESLARHYSDAYGMSMICLRLGRVNPENRPVDSRNFSVWCSYRDVSQLIEKCIDAPDSVGFDIFYAVSNNKWSYRDISHARDVVGYEPQDAAEEHRG